MIILSGFHKSLTEQTKYIVIINSEKGIRDSTFYIKEIIQLLCPRQPYFGYNGIEKSFSRLKKKLKERYKRKCTKDLYNRKKSVI
jgi:hypothetical protein